MQRGTSGSNDRRELVAGSCSWAGHPAQTEFALMMHGRRPGGRPVLWARRRRSLLMQQAAGGAGLIHRPEVMIRFKSATNRRLSLWSGAIAVPATCTPHSHALCITSASSSSCFSSCDSCSSPFALHRSSCHLSPGPLCPPPAARPLPAPAHSCLRPFGRHEPPWPPAWLPPCAQHPSCQPLAAHAPLEKQEEGRVWPIQTDRRGSG